MKFKKVVAGMLAVTSAAAMSVSVMAAGSVTDAVDTNNVTAETTTQNTESEKETVGGLEMEVETVGATLSKDVANLYEEEIQKVVDALQAADACLLYTSRESAIWRLPVMEITILT